MSWFESYLSNRTQQVNINTNKSKIEMEKVLSGVPQGHILGSMLFFIFINGLPLFIGDSI